MFKHFFSIIYLTVFISQAIIAQNENNTVALTKKPQKLSLLSFNRTPVLFSKTNLLSNRALDCSLQYTSESSIQKVVIAPFRFHSGNHSRFLNSLHFNLAQESGMSTLGVGIAIFNKTEHSENRSQYQLVLGTNLTLFSGWGSPSIDLNKDSLIDNEYSISQKNYSLALIGSRNTRLNYFASLIYQQGRETPVENTPEILELGYSVGFSKSIVNSTSFNELQIQSGLVIEHLLPIENQFAKNEGNSYMLSIAPTIDIQLNYWTQVRINLPFVITEGNIDERGFGSFFQLFLSL